MAHAAFQSGRLPRPCERCLQSTIHSSFISSRREARHALFIGLFGIISASRLLWFDFARFDVVKRPRDEPNKANVTSKDEQGGLILPSLDGRSSMIPRRSSCHDTNSPRS